MKKVVCFLLTTLLISCYYQNINPAILNTECGECNKEALPSFDPINYNENVIFLSDTMKREQIYAIDTSTDTLIYVYNFNKRCLTRFLFNPMISSNVFFNLDFYNCLHVLNPETGKVDEYFVNYSVDTIVFVESKIELRKNISARKDCAIKCKLFNPKTKILEDFTIPEGNLGNRVDTTIKINNKSYLPIRYDFPDATDNAYPTIYNITDKKLIDFYPERNYRFFHFVGDRYLYAYKAKTYLVDIYEVESFEPVNAKIIHSQQESDEDIIGLRIFEDEDYLYIFDQLIEYIQITKRRKSDYAIVDQKVVTTNYEPGGVPYFINNHFWIVALDFEGAYKINKDLEITVVK